MIIAASETCDSPSRKIAIALEKLLAKLEGLNESAEHLVKSWKVLGVIIREIIQTV